MPLTPPKLVTLTGVDDHTSLAECLALARRHPCVEWGILYSPARSGKGGRYPSPQAAQVFLEGCIERNVATAVHLCGQAVPDALEGIDPVAMALVTLASRVQLNFNQRRQPVDLDRIDAFAQRWAKPIITQLNSANANVHGGLRSPYHRVLFDASGGRGVRVDSWPSPLPGHQCGYAGGLGPETLVSDLSAIALAAGSREYWIDMETSLRNGADRFDLDRCAAVLATVDAWTVDPP